MITKARLTSDIQHQEQPCNNSCVPTCIAMAIGVSVYDLFDHMDEIGIGVEDGMHHRDVAYLLSTLGMAEDYTINRGWLGIAPGHYLVSIASKNFIGKSHCILVYVDEEHHPEVYDPNLGRFIGDSMAEAVIGWDGLAPIAYGKLDDFADYRKDVSVYLDAE